MDLLYFSDRRFSHFHRDAAGPKFIQFRDLCDVFCSSVQPMNHALDRSWAA